MCETCHGDGLYLKGNNAVFCECPEGRRRKSAWMLACEMVQEEARKDRAKRWRRKAKPVHDYKAEAGGEREPGEDDVPF
jgi:hypothetical protein